MMPKEPINIYNDMIVSSQMLCTTIAVVLHYLFLSSFCWMLAEGIMLYLLVVKVFGKMATRWYYSLFLGWGKFIDNGFGTTNCRLEVRSTLSKVYKSAFEIV